MSANAPERPIPSHGQHVATVSHLGRFWEVYLELADDPRRPHACRGVLCFAPTDLAEGERVARTAEIIIEPTADAALRRARVLDEHQLVALLRSVLPD